MIIIIIILLLFFFLLYIYIYIHTLIYNILLYPIAAWEILQTSQGMPGMRGVNSLLATAGMRCFLMRHESFACWSSAGEDRPYAAGQWRCGFWFIGCYYHSNNLDWYGYIFILLSMFQLLSSQVPHDFAFISMHQSVVCVIKFLWGQAWISGEKSGAGPGHAKWSCCLLLMAWDVSSWDMRALHVSLPQVKIDPIQFEDCKAAYQDNGDVVFGLMRLTTIRMI